MADGQRMADWRAACLTAGRYDLLAGEYAFPLTVYLPGAPAMVAGPQDLQAFFRSFHAALRARGVRRVLARVTAQGLPQRGRARLWTDWLAEGPGRAPELVAQTVCYSRHEGARALTEMVEFTTLDLALPVAA